MAGAGNSGNDDGSEIFWPGYVDATTNLILNLLFLVTILIVAVFMFALELGRAIGPQDANADHTAKIEEVADVDPAKENIVLKNEIKRLQKLLAEKNAGTSEAGGITNIVAGTKPLEQPDNGLEQAGGGDFDLVVEFRDDAVSFNTEERQQLLEALKPVAASQGALIYVDVPAGFTEAKRMGFYRALEVRNLLIELGMPTAKIDVSVKEGTRGSNASVVKVKSR